MYTVAKFHQNDYRSYIWNLPSLWLNMMIIHLIELTIIDSELQCTTIIIIDFIAQKGLNGGDVSNASLQWLSIFVA